MSIDAARNPEARPQIAEISEALIQKGQGRPDRAKELIKEGFAKAKQGKKKTRSGSD